VNVFGVFWVLLGGFAWDTYVVSRRRCWYVRGCRKALSADVLELALTYAWGFEQSKSSRGFDGVRPDEDIRNVGKTAVQLCPVQRARRRDCAGRIPKLDCPCELRFANGCRTDP
jgi:hypothetical protein